MYARTMSIVFVLYCHFSDGRKESTNLVIVCKSYECTMKTERVKKRSIGHVNLFALILSVDKRTYALVDVYVWDDTRSIFVTLNNSIE